MDKIMSTTPISDERLAETLPDDIRVPLYELQADARYLFGRVAADGSVAGAMADAALEKLNRLEAAVHAEIRRLRAAPAVVVEERLDAACKAFSEARVTYPGTEVQGPLSDWFSTDAQDAVDFGVLKEPKWDGYSDIACMQQEWYIAAVVREPMRAALSAALAGKEPGNV